MPFYPCRTASFLRAGAIGQPSLQHLEHAIHILNIWFDGLSPGDELAMVEEYDSRIDCNSQFNIVVIKQNNNNQHIQAI